MLALLTFFDIRFAKDWMNCTGRFTAACPMMDSWLVGV